MELTLCIWRLEVHVALRLRHLFSWRPRFGCGLHWPYGEEGRRYDCYWTVSASLSALHGAVAWGRAYDLETWEAARAAR
jgi:hypothetical protein